MNVIEILKIREAALKSSLLRHEELMIKIPYTSKLKLMKIIERLEMREAALKSSILRHEAPKKQKFSVPLLGALKMSFAVPVCLTYSSYIAIHEQVVRNPQLSSHHDQEVIRDLASMILLQWYHPYVKKLFQPVLKDLLKRVEIDKCLVLIELLYTRLINDFQKNNI